MRPENQLGERLCMVGIPLHKCSNFHYINVTVSPPLLRAEAIGKCQARGLAQVNEKNQPEGLNARAELVLSSLRSALRTDREKIRLIGSESV